MADFEKGYKSIAGYKTGAVDFSPFINGLSAESGFFAQQYNSNQWNRAALSTLTLLCYEKTIFSSEVIWFVLPLRDSDKVIQAYCVAKTRIGSQNVPETKFMISRDPGGNNIIYESPFIILNGAGGNDYVAFEMVSTVEGEYIGIVASDSTDQYTCSWVFGNAVFFNVDKIKSDLHLDAETLEDSPTYGKASQEGGYSGGTFDDSSDVVGIPSMPTIGVSSVGFVNVYDISVGGLASFGMDLFPDLSFTPIGSLPAPADVTDALVNMATVLVDFGNQIPNIVNMYINSNLINYIIDCHIIPVAPSIGGSERVKVGFKTFNQTANRVGADYIDFDCGTINIGEYYTNFADYEPYTHAKLYLPFVGFIDIKPEFWQSGYLNVTYRFNVIDGSFIAFVKSTSSKSNLSDTVIAQFGGNCCVHVPITGANYSNLVSGVVGGAQSIAGAQPGTGGSAAINAAINLANTKANVPQSNSYNATTSFLGVRVPFLMIERTVSNMSSAYPDEIGIPGNINLDFSDLSGLVQSQNVILDGITGATDAELKEIARLLAGGVYF